VTEIAAELMKKEGANTPIEALRQVPFFVGTTRTENDSNGGDGSAFINLYGLGSNNVLTLINGRRAFGFANVNAIPISALARVEIFAAGVYGSDSTAGVVNFIFLNGPGEAPYEGAELYALYGNTTDADAHVRQVYLRGGVTGLDGKVSIAAAGEYYSRANLFARDREISRTGDLGNNATGLGLGGFNNNSPTYAGRVSVAASQSSRYPVVGQLTLINLSNNAPTPGSYRRFDVPAGTDPDRYNFRDFTPAIPAVEKAMYFVTGRYKIFGDGLQLYGDIAYSKTKQDNALVAAPFAFGPEARPSPFNPFGNDLATVRYRLQQDLGNRESFFDQDTYRYVVGINGDFNFKDNGFISRFGYDSGFVYERFDQQRIDAGDALFTNLLGETVAGNFNPFIGQNAPIVGTAPTYNGLLFDAVGAPIPSGVGAYDNRAAAQRASYLGHSFSYERDFLYDVRAFAHLFPNLWNGGIDVAAGYEHREVNPKQLPDPVQVSNDQLGFAQVPRFKYRQEVDSWFFEFNIPLITATMNVPWVRSLDLGIAWRRDEFSSTNLLLVPGSPVQTSASFANENPEENVHGSPTVTLRYQPFSDLMFRASWRQSIRTPTLEELFTPVLQNFPVFFGTGIFPLPSEGIWIGGNPTLTPEKTDAYSAGIVWSPSFVPGFLLTIDWYQLFTRDVILDGNYFWELALAQNSISGGTAFLDPDGCGGGSGTIDGPGGPGLGITRDAEGNLVCIDSLNSNAGKRLVQGLEVTASYDIPTERFGKFTFSGGYNHFFTWKAEPLAGTGAHSFLGSYNNGSLPFGPGAIPYNKGFLRGEWEWRGFDFVATGNYIGDFQDDPTFLAGNTQIGGTDADPEFALHRRVTSYITLDMQLSYEWQKPEIPPGPVYSKDAKGGETAKSTGTESSVGSIWQRLLWGTKLTVGVNNAFDRNPPTVLAAPNDNYDTSLYSIRNRYYYVAVSKKF
jgi:iron complex outermembrane receptor protein